MYHHWDALKPTKLDHEHIDMSLLHMNIQSLAKKNSTFVPLALTSEIKFNIISLTETWLKNDNVDTFGIEGYNHEYTIRDSKTGGGTSMFIKENLLYKRREDLSYQDNDYELLWLEFDKHVFNSSSNIIIGTIYRTPGSDPFSFIQKLHDTLDIIDSEKKKCIHCGDYNLNLLNSSNHYPKFSIK
jgi:exonuclease III